MSTGDRIPDLAVIIPAHNEASGLGECLESIRVALEYAEVTEAEVIVVDDHSTDETSDVARAHGALAIRQSRRLGQMAACSLGVASSSASLLFFVDADCRVDEAAFSALLRGFARPAVGVVAARSEPEPRAHRQIARGTLRNFQCHIAPRDQEPSRQPRLLAHRAAVWSRAGPRGRRVTTSSGRATGSTPRARNALGGKSSIHAGRGRATTSRSKRMTSSGPLTFARHTHTHGRDTSATGWSHCHGGPCAAQPVASVRRQPLSAAAWLALRMRLWSERVRRGLTRPWRGVRQLWHFGTRLPHSSPSLQPSPAHHQTPECHAGDQRDCL